MTSKTTKAGRRSGTPVARLLALVLLVFITHSATVEIVHQHGSMLAAGSASAASFTDQNTGHSSGESSRMTGACLICQLHQHLFQTLLISTHPEAPPPG